MIIDFHCHTSRTDLLDQPWSPGPPLLVYLRRARAAGIHKTVVFSHLRANYAAGNAEVARVVAQFADRLIGFVFVNAAQNAGRLLATVERAVQQYGFRGIKAHAINAPLSHEVCEAAQAFQLPLLLDVAGRPAFLERLAPRYPDVSFIIAHLGSFNDDLRAQQRVVELMAGLKNVYGDTSAVRRFDSLVCAVSRAGAQKLVFGTDAPWLHPGVELQKIRALRLPLEQESLILGRNAARLLRLPTTLLRTISSTEDGVRTRSEQQKHKSLQLF